MERDFLFALASRRGGVAGNQTIWKLSYAINF